MTDVTSERRSAKGDFAAGVVLLALCAIGAWNLGTNKFIMTEDYGHDPGPGLLPWLLLGLLALSAVALMALSGAKLRRTRGGARDTGGLARSLPPLLVPALMIVAMAVYSQAMAWLGFLESTVAFALFWTVVLGLQDTRRPSAAQVVLWLAEGVAICAVIYAVFVWLIKIPVP